MFRSSNIDFHLDGGFELCCDVFLRRSPVRVEPESQAWRHLISRDDVHNIVVIRIGIVSQAFHKRSVAIT